MSSCLRQLRDFILPISDRDLEDPDALSFSDIAAHIAAEKDDAKLRKMYETIADIAATERERDESIVRRSTSFLAAVSILSALILGFGFSNLGKADSFTWLPAWVYVVLSILHIFILACISISVIRALEAIETEKFYTVGAEEASKISSVTELDYLKELVTRTVEYTEKNYRVTNRRISRYADAWRYLGRGIFLLLVYGVARVILFEYAACLGK